MTEETGSLLAGKPERSRRRRSPLRRFLYRLLAPLIDLGTRALWATCRVVATDGDGHWRAGLAGERACVPCFWHQHLVLCILRLQHDRANAERVAYLVSPSIDGDLFTRVLERQGSTVVRGSSTRSGVRAMRGLYRATAKHGLSPVITPDGPTGPVREAKAGAIILAQLSKVPVLPISFACSWSLRAPSWDRLIVPLPFTRVAFAVGAPIEVPRSAGEAELEELRRTLEGRLNELETRAQGLLGG